MKAIIAIPVQKDCLSTHFRECSYYALYTIKQRKITKKIWVKPDAKELNGFAEWFKSLNVTDVVTYKINHSIIDAFIKNKINVFVGTNPKAPDAIIEEYMKGELTSNENIINN